MASVSSIQKVASLRRVTTRPIDHRPYTHNTIQPSLLASCPSEHLGNATAHRRGDGLERLGDLLLVIRLHEQTGVARLGGRVEERPSVAPLDVELVPAERDEISNPARSRSTILMLYHSSQ